MVIKNKLKIISLGGAGGCGIRMKTKKIKNNPTFIYDWIVCSQDFIIKSFFDYSHFIKFDNNDMNMKYPYHYNDELEYIDAIAIHADFNLKNNYIFMNRFEKLQETMKKNKIVLIRYLIDENNPVDIFYSKDINNIGFYSDNIKNIPNEIKNTYSKTSLKLYQDNIEKWCKFQKNIINHYNNKDIILILFSDLISGDSIENIDENVFLIRAYNWKIVNKILKCNIIDI
jgi:hypothetical protein